MSDGSLSKPRPRHLSLDRAYIRGRFIDESTAREANPNKLENYPYHLFRPLTIRK